MVNLGNTPKMAVVTPVFNDWESLHCLLEELNALHNAESLKISRVLVVNDGSSVPALPLNVDLPFEVVILSLNTNMGHQRAISVGLSYIEENPKDEECIIVMDSDGEDRPVDIAVLIKQMKIEKQEVIVFAKRQKRSEGLWFKGFYKLYKFSFKMLTSHHIDFGNFSCIPAGLLKKVVSVPEIWNHYSGGIIKSRIPYRSVGTNRGKRYAGVSKMNFQNLVLHGLSAIAIYLDIVSIRLLMMALTCIGVVVVGLLVILYLALFTNLAIPGWSSITGLILMNILVIFILMTFLILLFQLNQKNTVKFPPKAFYKDFIYTVEKW